MKKILMCLFLCLSLCACAPAKSQKTIVTTNFPAYDFVRAIVGKQSGYTIKLLIKPGTDTHSYEPTPKDIVAIENADLSFYVGGDSDEWVENILNDVDRKKTKVVKMMDLINHKYEEESVEGMQEEHGHEEEEEPEYDEHVWTSPVNAMQIVKNLAVKIENMDPAHKTLYQKNSENYIKKIREIHNEFKNVVAHAKRKELIFGDRFPLLYFVKTYGLTYSAAFAGCAEETEPSAATMTYLINKVRKDHIHYVLKIELSAGKVAQTIASETGAKVLTFSSIHNVSSEDFKKGITYVDVEQNNVKVLRKVLER